MAQHLNCFRSGGDRKVGAGNAGRMVGEIKWYRAWVVIIGVGYATQESAPSTACAQTVTWARRQRRPHQLLARVGFNNVLYGELGSCMGYVTQKFTPCTACAQAGTWAP